MIRQATARDVDQIKSLIERHAEEGKMLLRTVPEICASIRDFLVYEDGDRVLGCTALHVFTRDLAEIRSLAVDREARGSGAGRHLVEAALDEAGKLGLERVFALTFIPEFFVKCGFDRLADKSILPHKVWTECIRCPFFPDCPEEAVMKEL
jgi:amino-acid N-acetyltransferase